MDKNQGIGFLPGDAMLLGYIVGRAQWASVASWFKVEAIYHPALEVRLSAGGLKDSAKGCSGNSMLGHR